MNRPWSGLLTRRMLAQGKKWSNARRAELLNEPPAKTVRAGNLWRQKNQEQPTCKQWRVAELSSPQFASNCLLGAICFWYLQYFKIISPLKELPSGGSGKKFIPFILNILGEPQKAWMVPIFRVGGAHAFEQTALPYNRGRDPARSGTDSVSGHIARRIRPRDAAGAHGNSRNSGPGSGDQPEQTGRPLRCNGLPTGGHRRQDSDPSGRP